MSVHSIESTLSEFHGARSVRVIDAAGVENPVHSHASPILSLYIMGRQKKVHREGETLIAGPAAVLHDPAAPHRNLAGAEGAEQLDIEFEPGWLDLPADLFRQERVHCWVGGSVGAASKVLISEWCREDRSEAKLADLTRRFLSEALKASAPKHPRWLDQANCQAAQSLGPVDTRTLAARLGLHPAWLSQAYRRSIGEGLQETAQRRRVERAVHLLRETSATCADIAADTGFCDQSHMVRVFRRVLSRSPSVIRAESKFFSN